jgi:pilus assembly protein CpaE
MPDHAFPDAAEDAQHRPERRPLLCFVADAETEQALRSGLSEFGRLQIEFHRAGIEGAITALRGIPTPWTLVVDVAAHPQPLAALEDLSQVVEPDVRVLVVGDRQDVGFYRQLTRSFGVADYLYKPLTAAMVAEHFGPVVARRRFAAAQARGGRLLTVTGARGGVGASTIAGNLAWFLAEVSQRHVAMLDADLHRGIQPLLLAVPAGTGLRNAVEHPERVDELFVERLAAAAGERLHLLAAEEPLGLPLAYGPGAAERLIGMLRRRHNFIIADAPFAAEGFSRDLLDLAQQRILVFQPTLACIRDVLRLLQIEAGPAQASRPLLVLNRAGIRGGLSAGQVAEALKLEPDIVIADLPRRVEEAATLGQMAAGAGGPFRNAIAQLAHAAGGVGSKAAARRGLRSLFRR